MSVFGTLTNLVEIDLLPRPGNRCRMWGSGHGSHYRILVSRARQAPVAFYLFSVCQPIPDFPLPLQPDEAEPLVELNRIVHDLYDHAGYDCTSFSR